MIIHPLLSGRDKITADISFRSFINLDKEEGNRWLGGR